MTPEQIRIAIAEACGAEWGPDGLLTFASMRREDAGPRRWELKDGRCLSPFIPDYCNDLNAMHEAESRLAYEDQLTLMVQLCPIVGLSGEGKAWWDLECHEAFKVYNSTARQRAEAFLRTIGKWEGAE